MRLDTSKQHPDIPPIAEAKPCKYHPTSGFVDGFGLAGGGYGHYVMCRECGRIQGKDQEDDG